MQKRLYIIFTLRFRLLKMVHKKYITRGGKTYGPYYYESYRENGRVKKKYVGMGQSDQLLGMNKAFTLQLLVVVGLLLIIGSLGIYSITGNSISDVEGDSTEAASIGSSSDDSQNAEIDSSTETIVGSADPVEQQSSSTDDSSPSPVDDSTISSSNSPSDSPSASDSTAEVPLVAETDVAEDDSSSSTPDSYSISDENSSEVASGIESTEAENITVPSNESPSTPDSTNYTAPATENTENATVIANETSHESNSTNVSVVEPAPEAISNESIANETNQSEVLPVLNTSITLLQNIPLTRIPRNGSAQIDLSDYFAGAESYSASVEGIVTSFNGDVLTLSPSEGFIGAAQAIIIAHASETDLESNQFTILVSNGAISIQTTREQVKVGEPVRWIKNVTLEDAQNISVQLPAEAEEVKVTKIEGKAAEELRTTLTGNVISAYDDGSSWIGRLFRSMMNLFSPGGITGNVVSTGTDSDNQTLEVSLNESATQYTIEYTTPGPTAIETETARGKQVVISAPESLNYTDVIASSTLPSGFTVRSAETISILWRNYDVESVAAAEARDAERLAELRAALKNVSEVPASIVVEDIVLDENGTVVSLLNQTDEVNVIETAALPSIVPSVHFDANGSKYIIQEVAFDAYDLDADGNIDYVEWVVPHFSEQFYEIILVTRAEHLDEGRAFIEDAYEQVKAIDTISITIPTGHYLRVTFEQNLTNQKDITIYANSTDNATVHVYEKDSGVELAVFTNITGFERRQILLQNLTEGTMQDTFDLLVKGNDVSFDHVIDPEINASYETGLILLYHFNKDSFYEESDTRIVDHSVMGFNITNSTVTPITNITFIPEGRIGGGAHFNNTHDPVIDAGDFDIGDNFTTSGGFTVSIWVKPENALVSTSYTIISKQRSGFSGWELSRNQFEQYTFSAKETAALPAVAISSTAFADTNWHHLVGTFDGSDLMFYVDGVNMSSPVDFPHETMPSTTFPLCIGAGSGNSGVCASSSGNWNGTLDEVAIWNRSLSRDEVRHLYSLGAAASFDIANVTHCMNLTYPNTIYQLSQNISATSTCLTVMANNITIDGAGHILNYSNSSSTGYGINVTGYNDTKIMNLHIREGTATGSSRHGILLTRAHNTTIINNSITVLGTASHGMLLTTASSSNITGNILLAQGGNANALVFQTTSARNTISYNNVTASGNNAQGITALTTFSGMDFNTISYNNVTVTVTNGYGIYMAHTNLTVIHGNNVTTSGAGILVGVNSIVTNNTVSAASAGFFPMGIGIYLSAAQNIGGNNTLSYNSVTSPSEVSYYVGGTIAAHFDNNIDSTNLAEGLPVSYISLKQNLSSSDVREIKTYDGFLKEGLVGLWHLNNDSRYGENTTNISDFSGYGNNGSVVGGAIVNASGHLGKAYTWDGSAGSGQYIELGNAPSTHITGDAVTVAAWVQRANVQRMMIAGRGGIFGGGTNSYALYHDSFGTGFGFIATNAASQAVSVTYNAPSYAEYHHVVGVYNGTNLTLYVDGILRDTDALTGPLQTAMGATTNKTRIGGASTTGGGSQYSWNGSIDEVAIWNRSLSPAEVRQLYNRQMGNFTGAHGIVMCAACTNVTYANITMGGDGISLINSSETAVRTSVINASSSSGIYIYNNGTDNYIINNTIRSTTSFYPIRAAATTGLVVQNNNISASASSGRGISMDTVNRPLIINNYVNTTGANAVGVFLGTVTYLYFDNNTVHSSGSGSTAVSGFTSSSHNLLVNSSLTAVSEALFWGNNAGSHTTNNTFIGLTLNTTGSAGSAAFGLSSRISNFSLIDTQFIGLGQNLRIGQPQSSQLFLAQWNLTNVTNSSGHAPNVSSFLANGTLNVHWYALPTAYVNQTGTPLSGANISLWNSESALLQSALSNNNGTVPRHVALSYSMANTSILGAWSTAYSEPIKANATKSGYILASNDSINMTNNMWINLSLQQSTVGISFASPTPANGTIQAAQSIYVNVSSTTSYDHYVLTDFDNSLLGLWRMDELNATGSVVDLSSFSHNATAVGNAVQNISGRFGKAFSFDGDGDALLAHGTTNLTDNLTSLSVSAWIKRSSSGTQLDIASQYRNGFGKWILMVSGGGNPDKVQFWVTNSSGTESAAGSDDALAADSNWHHVAGVYNGTHIAVYVDGVFADTTPAPLSGPIIDRDYNVCIGGETTGAGNCEGANYNGSIDEVIILNRSLNQAEIYSLYNASATKYQNNFTNLAPRAPLYSFKSYAVDLAGNVNSTETRYISIPAITSLDAYTWAERAGWFAQSQNITAVDNRTYIFANYTVLSTADSLGPNALCNVTFIGGTQDGLARNMTFNSTASLYYYNKTFQYAGNYSWNVSCSVGAYEPQSFQSTINATIPIRNATALGHTTKLATVNHNENVNLTVYIPSSGIDNSTVGYNLSNVWANVTRPDGIVTRVFLSGNRSGGVWTGNYSASGVLGNYTVHYYANLTNRYQISENMSNTFMVKNTSISILVSTRANTTQTIPINGQIRILNGTGIDNLANNLFVISLNGVTVSSDTYSDTNFTGGTGTGVNRSNIVQLNLSGNSGMITYSDDFSTNKYETESVAYTSPGYAGKLFALDSMTSAIGNVTYRFTSPTQFFNASVRVVTQAGLFDGGGNTSIHYSLDNVTWVALASSTAQGANLTGTIPVNGRSTFYVMLSSNTNNFNNQNPILFYSVNYTQYQYAPYGNFVSRAIYLPNVTYTVFRWGQNISGGQIAVQVRESDDGNTWGAWSSNFTNNLVNSITSFTRDYVQYNVTLTTTNLNTTPVFQMANISYFNATTNSTGGYNYNITIPTDYLGVQPLQVSVVQSPEGIVGFNSTNITVWAETSTPYYVVRNYSHANANYSLYVNFTRVDTGDLVNGTINVTIRHSGGSVTSRQCAGSQCIASWLVPLNTDYGNYSINITAHNESAFYINASANFTDFLEQRNTSGTLRVLNRTINDLTAGVDYQFYWNLTINNTGNASMLNALAYNATKPSIIRNFTFLPGCTRVYPGQSCNVTALITIAGGTQAGTYQIPFRANWSDNDGSIAGGSSFISYTEMYIIISLNASMALSNQSVNMTLEHGTNNSFNFSVLSTGTDTLIGVELEFLELNRTSEKTLNSSWVNITPSSFATILPGANRNTTVTVSMPLQTAPGNYSGVINVTGNGGSNELDLIVLVPVNGSWNLVPAGNFSYNRSFSLASEGEVGNYTLVNTGNVNLTFNISYSPTAGAGTDYSVFGSNLFGPNYLAGSVLTNPTGVNVTKGGNRTITLWQRGNSEPLADVGVTVRLFNASASPQTYIFKDSFEIEEQPPAAGTIWFSLDGFNTNTTIGEQNKNMTLKAYASDDVDLDASRTVFNVTWPTGSSLVNASVIEGQSVFNGLNREQANYSAIFMPTTTGVYSVFATIFDTAGNSVTSGLFNFTTFGSTIVTLAQNMSSANVSTVDLTRQGLVYVNYTVNNTGVVAAYSPTITFTANSSIIVSGQALSDLSASSLSTVVVRMNVSRLTPPGQYNVTATLTWRNPNNIVSTDAQTITLNVLANKSIIVLPSTVTMGNIVHATSNSTTVLLNNTGNAPLTGASLACQSGSLCSNFTVSFNASDFTISSNSTRLVNVTLSVPRGLAAGSYNGIVNISEANVSTTFELQATVPATSEWNTSTTQVIGTAQSLVTGTIGTVIINNTGNTQLSFLLSSSNGSLIYPNSSSFSVPAASSGTFTVNYSSPESEGTYNETIYINESTLTATPAAINVSVSLTVTKLITRFVSPTNASPQTNVLAGDLISIVANLTYVQEIIANSTEWSGFVGETACTNTSYSYNSVSTLWEIGCYAPSIADGRTYNLTLVANHTTYGVFSQTEEGAVVYRDVSAPIFNITQNNINKNANISLLANISDNVQISTASIVLTYPNGTTYASAIVNGSNGLYTLTNFTLDLAGEYTVNYSATDTTGNANSTVDWFEVYDRYTWSGRTLDSASVAVSGINMTLFRPNSTTILLSNITNVNGLFSLNVNRRFYDLQTALSGDSVTARSVNFSNVSVSNITLSLHKLSGELLTETIPLFKPFIGIVNNATGLGSNPVQAVFNYSGYGYDTASQLKIVQCSSWNYTVKQCTGSWSTLASSINVESKLVTGNGTGMSTSAFFLAENKCGNGACEATYSETTGTCSLDCQSPTVVTTSGGGGGGGGGGGLSASDLNKIAEIVRGSINFNGVRLDTTSIYRELFAGDTSTVTIKVVNTLDTKSDVLLATEGEVLDFLSYESNVVPLESGESRDVLVRIAVPKFTKAGDYVGNIRVTSGDKNGTIPVTIKVLSPEGKLLDVKIQPLQSRVAPGNVLKLQLDLLNLGQTKRVDIQFELQLIDVDNGAIFARQEEAFAVETTTSVIKNMSIPSDVPVGKYLIKGTAYYASLEASNQTASSIAELTVDYPLWRKRFLFVPFWLWFLAAALIAAGVGSFAYVRYVENKNKRFKSKIEFNKLPQPGPNAAFVGKIAETGIRAFTDLNKLQMHTLIAGSTGGGKTVAAQAIVEAALLHNKSIIVFDPTAQWTGFFRKCEEKNMLNRYSFFDMKTGEARAFNGTIKTIRDPYEIIDIKKYMDRPGEITVFNVSNLSPAEIDILAASTIEQIFNSHPEESSELKTLIVYDEVHRLLPKFGGTGKGFIQIERGAREFRKWGIGLMLISQVLSDFIGEIKANIGTEIQLGTRYEGDLERVNVKYGEDVLKSVVKEPIGTGMVVNAEYNGGRPYFVAFRPLLHSTKRLSKTDLEKYEKYYEQIEDIEFQIDELKKLNADVFDLALELKLTREKVKEGQFQIADMYLESLNPNLEAAWAKVGKKPMHIEKAKLSKKQVEDSLSKAAAEREEYAKKNPQKELSLEESLDEIAKILKEKKGKKDTSKIEVKFNDFASRVKSYKGKLSDNDKAEIQKEMDSIKKEAQEL